MGHFYLRGLIKPRIWTPVITFKLDIAYTFNSIKEYLTRASPSSTGKGQWVLCKSAWGQQMASNVSMCHTQQFSGWWVAYNWLGPTGTVHVVGYIQETCRQRIGLFTWNTNGISGDYPQKTFAENQDLATSEYPHIPWFIISDDWHWVAHRLHRSPILNRQGRAVSLHWVTVQRHSFLNLPQTFVDQMQSIYSPGERIAVLYPTEHRRGTSLVAR